MRTVFIVKPIKIALFFVSIGFYGCVQPYSSKAFYKSSGTDGRAPSSANASAQSLSVKDVSFILNSTNLSGKKVYEILQKNDRHWWAKGFDGKTGETFYVNFYSEDNKEAFVWHSKENIAEYVTMNTDHYHSILEDLKTTGYKATGSSSQNGDSYSNGSVNVSVSQVQLYNNSKGYKIIFTNKN